MRGRGPHVSNAAADRAGETLRAAVRGEAAVSGREVLAAIDTVRAYRDMHEYPMRKATISVASFIKTVTRDPSLRPGQRFKRMERIVDKLLDQVYRVAARIKRYWKNVKTADYIETPKPSGYRALHLIARRDGRLIEIQLRTRQQDSWAVAVETWAPPEVDFNLKDDPLGAPEPVRQYFCRMSEAVAEFEKSGRVSATLREEIDELAAQLVPWTSS